MTSERPEWEKIEDGIASLEEPQWWFRDNWDAVSHDGGETYYLLTDPMDDHGNLPVYKTAEKPPPSKDYPQDLQQAAAMAVGRGSTSWHQDGVFDEANAQEAVNDLVNWVNTHYEKKD